jgi:hypothetical protein
MIWLLSRLIVWPVKAVVGTTAFGVKTTAKTAAGSAKLGYRTGRLFGYKNMTFLALGVGIGLALAPGPGRELRERVKAKLVEQGLIAGGPPEGPSSLPDRAAVAATNGSGRASEPDAIELVPDEPGTAGPS